MPNIWAGTHMFELWHRKYLDRNAELHQTSLRGSSLPLDRAPIPEKDKYPATDRAHTASPARF